MSFNLVLKDTYWRLKWMGFPLVTSFYSLKTEAAFSQGGSDVTELNLLRTQTY